MKKILLLISVLATMVTGLSAQVCTPDSTNFTAGVFVYPPSLPCITQGSSFGANINIRIPDSIDAHLFDTTVASGTYLYVDSIQIDSVKGAPAGISVATNPTSTQWLYANQYGCIQFLGSTAAAAGSYPLTVYGNGCVHGMLNGNPVNTCYNGALPSYFNYSLGVCSPVVNTVCTPDTSQFTPGVTIYPATLPCITQNSAYSGTVNIKIPDSLDASLFTTFVQPGMYYVHLDSVRIDSIVGMPAGISVATNPGDSVWLHGGQYGCAVFSGTTSAATGNYHLTIFGKGCIHGTIFGIAIDSCQSDSLTNYLSYSLNVCSPGGGGACNVDSSHFGNGTQVYPATLPCAVLGDPFTGQINIQVPSSLDLTDFIPQIPANTATVYIDSIDITNISGYPLGLSSVSNPVFGTWLFPNSVACAYITGTPSGPVGNYPLTITGTGCGHFTLAGQTVHQCMNNYSFTKVFPYTLSTCYPAGITEITDGLTLGIYPNPNQGNFTVSLASSTHISGTLSVVDQLGRVIHTQTIDVTGAKQIALDLGNVSAGAYLLMVTTSESRSVKQFIVR